MTTAAPDFSNLTLNGAVPATVGLIALVAFGVLWFTGPHAPRVAVLLLMTGVAGLLSSPVGGWLRSLVDWVSSALSSVFVKTTGTWVSGLLGGAALALLIIRFKDKRIDRWTLALAVVVPVAVATIPGPVGRLAVTAVTAVTAIVAYPITYAFAQ